MSYRQHLPNLYGAIEHYQCIAESLQHSLNLHNKGGQHDQSKQTILDSVTENQQLVDWLLELAAYREVTTQERKSVKNYVTSISKPTGLNFDQLLYSRQFEELEIYKKFTLSVCDALHEMLTEIDNKDGKITREEHIKVLNNFIDEVLMAESTYELQIGVFNGDIDVDKLREEY